MIDNTNQQLGFLTTSNLFEEATYSVSSFLDHISNLIGTEEYLIEGEISSFSPRPPHNFITLTDPKDGSQLNCYCHDSKLFGKKGSIEEGVAVRILCKPNIFKKQGKFNVNIISINLIGEGALQKAFEDLKIELRQEGYFDEARKRDIPEFPQRIGLITSTTAAAKEDFLTHLISKGIKVYFMDARVEGIYAENEVANAIRQLNERNLNLDAIVVTRGGGSMESLQAFNSLSVAKAIFASKTPIISAIGHEQDTLISDLVADIRASTPTDAAKILSRDWAQAGELVEQYSSSIMANFGKTVASNMRQIENESTNLYRNYENILREYRRTLDESQKKFTSRYKGIVDRYIQKLSYEEELLDAHDPQKKLKQGYSIVTDREGRLVKSIKNISPKQEVNFSLSDGKVISIVKGVKANASKKNS